MRKLLTALLLLVGSVCMAQNATDFFNSAGNQYIDGNTEQALSTVNRGLKRYPGDEKLTKLLEELQKQQQQEQEQKDEQEQEQDQKDQQQKDDQQKQDQQKQDQEQKQDQQQKENQEKQQDQEQKQQDQEGKENEEKKEDQQGSEENKDDEQKRKDDLQKFLDKLKEMKISPEKAQMIMEAMRNNEIKYMQEKKRKATKRKDRTKPDW